MSDVIDRPEKSTTTLRQTHLVFGWTMLFVFIMVGLCLEALHAFKVSWYLDVGNDARRLMLRLAHAHGTLLALINIAFALSADHLNSLTSKRGEAASKSLKIASILLPGGFFLGGFFIYDGDPGLGVFVVPIGAIALAVAVALTALSAKKTSS
jgi:hypothetical protein